MGQGGQEQGQEQGQEGGRGADGADQGGGGGFGAQRPSDPPLLAAAEQEVPWGQQKDRWPRHNEPVPVQSGSIRQKQAVMRAEAKQQYHRELQRQMEADKEQARIEREEVRQDACVLS